MNSYGNFAAFYDRLTANIDYGQIADNLQMLMNRYGHHPQLLLDLACGTGGVTLLFAKAGIDVIGVDASAEMLAVARRKADSDQLQPLFLCQKMQEFELYGTVDTVVCCLDSINHLTSIDDVKAAFSRVSLFLEPGGLFLFDVNTRYKHREVLAGNTFVYDLDDLFCVWQCYLEEQTDAVDIVLDFFEESGGKYHRFSAEFRECVYPEAELRECLDGAGLDVLAVFGEDAILPPAENAERIVFVTRKRNL